MTIIAQYTHQFWSELRCVIAMSQASILSQSPSIEIPCRYNGCTVRAAACYVTNTLRTECFNQPRLVTVPEIHMDRLGKNTVI